MLSKLQHIWHGHLGRIEAAKHRAEIIFRDERLIYSALYQGGLLAPEIEKHRIDKMPALDVIEPAQTE